MQNTEIIKIENIKKTYNGKTVLNLNEISIQKGEVYVNISFRMSHVHAHN